MTTSPWPLVFLSREPGVRGGGCAVSAGTTQSGTWQVPPSQPPSHAASTQPARGTHSYGDHLFSLGVCFPLAWAGGPHPPKGPQVPSWLPMERTGNQTGHKGSSCFNSDARRRLNPLGCERATLSPPSGRVLLTR